MPLTPADVHNVAFKKPPIGKRGYDEEEVDAFLDEVERELARLLDENVSLRARVGPAADNDADQDRLRSELAALRSRMERALQEKAAAEQAATRVQSELEGARAASAAPAGTNGDSQGVRVLMMAQRTADDHVGDARREADGLLLEARAKAERTVQEAADKAAVIERDARQRHQQVVESLDKKRTDMMAEISGLEGLATDYRHRLRAALTNQLAAMESIPSENGRGDSRILNGSLG